MTTDERIEKLTTTLAAHESLFRDVGKSMAALALSIEAHDRQIDALITISEENARNWKNLEKQWQAYLNTLPRQ